jgi:heat-inducible transcriptional repressor
VTTTPVLTDRAQHLFKILVEKFIQDGKPVGSRSLAKEGGLDLSPATIRNVMSDLEELGLVSAPHTSAGRVPTATGYRFFIDSLLTVKPMTSASVEQLEGQFEASENPQAALQQASSMLSGLSHMAGLVTLPKREHIAFRHIEFLSLSQGRVLAILVTNEQEVHNRILYPSRDFSPSELTQASNYLNAAFAGQDVNEVKRKLVREMKDAQHDMNGMMLAAVDMGQKILNQESQEDFLLAGQNQLMDFDELSDVNRLKGLFDAFQEKGDILNLLEQSLQAEGVQIFIGEESGYDGLNGCSVVASPYTVNDDVVGVLGVIGPTRMQYEHVIPLVDVTAKLLGAALKPR